MGASNCGEGFPACGAFHDVGRAAAPLSSEILDRLPPQNLDAEKGVLGSLLLDPQLCDDVALLIRADDHLAGFALVNQWSALELPLDHAVAEFFVLRKYRRARVGTRAALFIFRRYPGRWEVPVVWCNPPALAFWRSVTEEAAPGR